MPFALAITLLFLVIGILPVIGVILRKREWKIADLPGENDDDWVIGDILRKKREREKPTKGLAEKGGREE